MEHRSARSASEGKRWERKEGGARETDQMPQILRHSLYGLLLQELTPPTKFPCSHSWLSVRCAVDDGRGFGLEDWREETLPEGDG